MGKRIAKKKQTSGSKTPESTATSIEDNEYIKCLEAWLDYTYEKLNERTEELIEEQRKRSPNSYITNENPSPEALARSVRAGTMPSTLAKRPAFDLERAEQRELDLEKQRSEADVSWEELVERAVPQDSDIVRVLKHLHANVKEADEHGIVIMNDDSIRSLLRQIAHTPFPEEAYRVKNLLYGVLLRAFPEINERPWDHIRPKIRQLLFEVILETHDDPGCPQNSIESLCGTFYNACKSRQGGMIEIDQDDFPGAGALVDRYLTVIKDEKRKDGDALRAARILAYLNVFIKDRGVIPILRKFTANNYWNLAGHEAITTVLV